MKTFRETKIQVKTILLGLVIGTVFSTPIMAGSKGRAIAVDGDKVAAPTKEDSADYFAEERKNVSPQAKKEADALRVKTIDQIKNILAAKNGKNEFELMLRLSELYVERADFVRDQEMEYYVFQYDKWKNADTKTRGKAPEVDYKASEAQLQLAVGGFRKLVTKYPKHPRTDAALFSLAKTLGRLNDDNAILYYKQMIANHPRSPLIPDAWLALGEFYFDKHKIPDATEAYQQVMNFKEHRAYPFAVYKLGWCHYNSQSGSDSLKKSIAAFKLVVKLSDKNKGHNFNLRDEAIRDLVMVFAETEDTEAAWNYFKTIGEEAKFYAMLERLGNTYADAGKNDKAIEVYTRLVKESPTKVNNPRIYQKLVGIYEQVNRNDDVVATIKTMHTLFAAQNSTWIAANNQKPELIKDASNVTERTTHRYGTLFHSRGQKIKNKALEANAAQIYEQYLASFAKAPAAYDIRYYLADIQMSQGKYEASSTNFLMVAKQKPKDGEHLKEAALMAVTAVAKLNEESKFPALPPAGQVPKPLEIPHARKLYADTIDQYISLLPNEKTSYSMRYTAAQIYFDYGNYDEAIKRFDNLATNHATTKQGQTAPRVVLGFYNEKTDWTSVIAYGKKYQNNKELMADAGVKKFVNDTLRNALFNSAMASEKAKDYDKAAAGFLEFRRMFPADKDADRALYNASLNFSKGGNVEAALAQQKILLNEYPKSELAPDVTASMAETYEALAQFGNAADTYRKFAHTWPSDKRAPNALYNSAVLYRGVKKNELAATSFAEVYRKYPNQPVANDALFESARIRESMGDANGALGEYKGFAAHAANKGKDDGVFAEAKTIEIQLKQNPKNETARRDLAKLTNQLKAKGSPAAPEGRRVVSQMLFNMQEPNEKSFVAMPLNNGSQIEKQVRDKQTKLEQVGAAYEEILALGNAEYSVASLYRLGEMHENFSQGLFNAPPPANYNQAQANGFKSQLEKIAFPLKTEAYKFFEAAYKRSQEVEAFTPWTSKTYQKMVELAPDKHKEIEEQSATPGYLSYKVSLTKATSSLAD